MNPVNTFYFAGDGKIPNNPDLPVLFYSGVFKDYPEQTERIFNRNLWLNSWTNGVFPYHHYHGDAHEVLGVIKGHALLMLGGASGREIEVRSGDVVVLPAGTGHKRLAASPDFKVVGAYPQGMAYRLDTDMDAGSPVYDTIRSVPLPQKDPVYGDAGPLLELWQKK